MKEFETVAGLLASLLKETGPRVLVVEKGAGVRVERVREKRLRKKSGPEELRYKVEYLPPDVMSALAHGRASLWPRGEGE